VEVKLAAGSTYARPTTLAAGTQLSFTGTGDLTTTATLTGDGNLVVNRAGTVLHNGVGSALLGTVTVNSGTLAVDGGQSANRFAINKLITVNTGATFEYRGVNATPTAANAIDLVVNAGTLRVVSGTSALANDSHGHMRDITLNGATMQLNYAGTGTAYNGESIQLNGTFIVGGSAPSVITTGAGGNDGNTGIALIGARLFDIGDVTTSAAPDLIVNAELENHDGGGGSLIKEGTGTMVLNQANSFSGGAAVQNGTLLVNGSLATGPVTVATGATLGGSGSIGGLVDVPAGATIAPGGASTGVLSVGNTLLGGSYSCDLSGSNADTLAVNGDLDLTGSTLNIVAGSAPTLAVYVLATYTGNLIPGATGTFGAITGLPAGYNVVHNPTLKRIELTNGTNPYGAWETLNGIAGAGAEADSDNDGIPNGIEFVIGGDPSGPGSDSSALLPTTTTDANYLNFTFRRTDESSPSNPVVQYGSNLAGWSDAVAGLNGVLINVTNDDFGTGVDRVEVKIPRNLAVGSKLFARLKVTIP
jgi:autotransporter-associated beta strand protein